MKIGIWLKRKKKIRIRFDYENRIAIEKKPGSDLNMKIDQRFFRNGF
jgi:hypothetical protein